MTTLDPFEARVRFSGMLQHMNANQNSAQKAAQFALKYTNLSDDLHSCILEQLEKGNMNVQANIMHFVDHFMDQAEKEGSETYLNLMQKDICKIVDIVAPPSGEGYMNVKTLRKILHSLGSKNHIPGHLVQMLDQQLSAQEKQNQARLDDKLPDAPPPPPPGLPAGYIPADKERSKRLVEQRVEEDRERHKRQREQIWQKTYDEEKDDLFENTSDFGDDDRLLGREEYARRVEGWREECLHVCEKNGHAEKEKVRERENERDREKDRDRERDRESDKPAPSASTAPPSGPAAQNHGRNGGGVRGGGRRDRGGGRDRRENGGRRGH